VAHDAKHVIETVAVDDSAAEPGHRTILKTHAQIFKAKRCATSPVILNTSLEKTPHSLAGSCITQFPCTAITDATGKLESGGI
jgi:hypothetical protein